MLIDAARCSLLLVDIQERLLPAMATANEVVAKSAILLKAAAELGIPVTISEQYPKGLGHTVGALSDTAAIVMEKLSFSCWRNEGLRRHFINFHEHNRPLIIVAGIEAHVCVLQTCIDLVNAGFGVFAVADAMSSRKPESVCLALERMRASGANIINTEMAVFELLQKAGTPHFKALSALIK